MCYLCMFIFKSKCVVNQSNQSRLKGESNSMEIESKLWFRNIENRRKTLKTRLADRTGQPDRTG
uniref:Uncharacterized protein n=1 Tax=Helianthus annuus TaxID=4232 RepID=A0A251TK86_HELAN